MVAVPGELRRFAATERRDRWWVAPLLQGAVQLPSMYQQFHELADMGIIQQPMEVGPTTHYMMGGVKVDAETQVATNAWAREK